MSNPVAIRLGLAAGGAVALALAGCATAPAPGPVARDETGVVVAARPIVVADAAAERTPAQQSVTPASAPPGAVTNPTTSPEVLVRVIADSVKEGETQQGVSYTIRRDRDGTLFEVAQPGTQALPQGTRVAIAYGDRTRLSPAS